MAPLRALRHRTATPGAAKPLFAHDTMARLTDAIVRGEASHRGDVRLVVESALPWRDAWRGTTTRQRALDLFGTLRAWDTAENNGVLLYVNLADRVVEVVADRGVAHEAGGQHWLFACQQAQDAFQRREFEAGIVAALDAIHTAITRRFPARPTSPH